VRGKLRALREGVVAEGEVVDVRSGGTHKGDGQHNWAIEYRFDGPDGPVQGRAVTWEAQYARWKPGHPVWVVYRPDQPKHNALWPPVT
jgi:hypothetical protein